VYELSRVDPSQSKIISSHYIKRKGSNHVFLKKKNEIKLSFNLIVPGYVKLTRSISILFNLKLKLGKRRILLIYILIAFNFY
jgi:hypothetical protein